MKTARNCSTTNTSIIERSNRWLGPFLRLPVRHEHLLATYRTVFYLACFWITLRKCL